tara:strand:- start:1682 stop:2566 length:885 start_codon:yes stop_codon:yes gene_type:complete
METQTPDTVTDNSVTVTETPVTVTETPVTVTDAAAKPAENAEATEAAPEAEAAPPVDDVEVNLEDLINAAFDGDPIMQGEHKGLPPYNEVLKHIPENGRKLIQNLRASYTRKTQEIADMRRNLAAEREELQRQRSLLANGAGAKAIREMANADTSQFDMWDEKGMQAHIRSEAAKMMQQMLKPIQEDYAVAQRRNELERFKSDHPDLMGDAEVKAGVVNLLKEREHLRLEDAYYLVRGKLQEQRATQLAAEKEATRSQQRQTFRKTSAGVNPGKTKAPQFRSAWEAYQWHKNNE